MEILIFALAVLSVAGLLSLAALICMIFTRRMTALGDVPLREIKRHCVEREHHCWSCPLHVGKGCVLSGPPCYWEDVHLRWRWPRKDGGPDAR